MDYSFLLKSEKFKNTQFYEVNRNCMISSDSKEVYHLGIIDYLQKWNFTKKKEQFAKRVFLKQNINKLSAVEPILYQKRFQKFMKDILLPEKEKYSIFIE